MGWERRYVVAQFVREPAGEVEPERVDDE